MQPIRTEAELVEFTRDHPQQNVLIYKHSTTCPISAAAYRQVERFAQSHTEVPVGIIRVIEERPLSQHFAAQSGVPHASPQIVLLQDGKPIWQATHYAITVAALESAINPA